MKVKKIKAAGGVVSRYENSSTEVLLIFRNGVWDIPKGKREKGESVRECATREVMEEVNASELPKIIYELVSTEHTYHEKGKEILKKTWWYAMKFNSDQEFMPQTKEGITKVLWVEVRKAVSKVDYENLKKVLKDFMKKENIQA